MSEKLKYNFYDANLDNVDTNLNKSKSTGYRYMPVQNIAEIVTRLGKLLDELPQNDPPREIFIAQLQEIAQIYSIRTDSDKQLFKIQFDYLLRVEPQIAQVLSAGGMQLVQIICLSLGIPIEMGQDWLQKVQKVQKKQNYLQFY